MTHRERIVAALDHRTSDRVPMDLGSTRVTSVSKVFYERLKEHYGIDSPTQTIDRIMQTAAVDEEILVAMDIDTRGILPAGPDNPKDQELDGGRWIDEWGVTRRLSPNGYYYELEDSPLAGEISMSDVSTFPLPDASDEGRYRGLAEKAKRVREETDYAIVGHSPGGWIHISQYLRGFEGWYMDFALQPDVIVAIMKRARDATLEAARRFLDEVGPYLDVVATGDDIGAQNGLQISPDMYREFIHPLQREQFAAFRSGTDAKIFYHTCGDVTSVMDDIIDMGVQILNPVQLTAGDMKDVERLKSQWGDRIAFWGGVDTMSVMPEGEADDVRAEVDRRVEVLGEDGGYVLCPVHNIQPDVSVENLLTLYEHGKSLLQPG